MTEPDVPQIAKHLADLRLQVNALETAAKNASLPETLQQVRRTIWWTSVIIAAALLVSAGIRYWEDSRIRTLENRIEVLEHRKP